MYVHIIRLTVLKNWCKAEFFYSVKIYVLCDLEPVNINNIMRDVQIHLEIIFFY